MDAVGIRSRIPSPRSLLLAALACAGAFAGSACSKSGADAYPAYRDGPAREASAGDAEPTVTPAERHTPVSSSTGDLTRLQRAIRLYAGDRAGRLPRKLDDLTKETSPEGDRYLVQVPLDPWGRPYAYAVVSARLGAYDLRSYGPDTLPGTDDDLVAEPQLVSVH